MIPYLSRSIALNNNGLKLFFRGAKLVKKFDLQTAEINVFFVFYISTESEIDFIKSVKL